MRTAIFLSFLFIAVTSVYESEGIPLSPDSALWHKISKRDTSGVVSPAVEDKKNNSSQSSTKEKESKPVSSTEDKTSTGNEDELIETQPDSLQPQPSADVEQSSDNVESENDASSDRSIDWQLLSGNPADLERELESRRRRRSIRSLSLSRQHRIRTAGRVQRSRSKRNTYYDVNPSDLLAAYAYLQARRQDQEEEEPEPEPQLSLLGDVSDSDLSNLASLIYELQRADESGDSPVLDDGGDDDQQVLPGGYVEYEPTNYEPEIRISPEQLAALEQALSEQQVSDDEEQTSFYPKDKRSLIDDEAEAEQDNDESEDDPEPMYLIPAAIEAPTEYVQIPLSNAYENPYDFYQIGEDPIEYDEAARRVDEEELRQRIASLIDDINEQRQLARRRRR